MAHSNVLITVVDFGQARYENRDSHKVGKSFAEHPYTSSKW